MCLLMALEKAMCGTMRCKKRDKHRKREASAFSFSLQMSSRSALIALHLIAEEGRNGEGCHVPGLGDVWDMRCLKSPMWESEGEVRSKDESASSNGSQEGNVGNDALHVIGLYGPGDKIFLFL